jgi:lipopolysaccharide/colanic/teichoic acid biosynthesis glycosyltransferase
MIPVIIVLKLTGEHDVFYLQPRIGTGGREFKMFKFVTMVRGSTSMSGGLLTQKNDPRVLPVGKFLRKTKINELPQLLNIFLGQMSVIGPRPQVKEHYDLYSDEIKEAIDSIPPGLSGIGSIVFRDEEKILDNISTNRNIFYDTILTPYKGQLELWFVNHRTLINYFLLIFLTAGVIIRPESNVYRLCLKDLPEIPEPLETLFV